MADEHNGKSSSLDVLEHSRSGLIDQVEIWKHLRGLLKDTWNLLEAGELFWGNQSKYLKISMVTDGELQFLGHFEISITSISLGSMRRLISYQMRMEFKTLEDTRSS